MYSCCERTTLYRRGRRTNHQAHARLRAAAWPYKARTRAGAVVLLYTRHSASVLSFTIGVIKIYIMPSTAHINTWNQIFLLTHLPVNVVDMFFSFFYILSSLFARVICAARSNAQKRFSLIFRRIFLVLFIFLHSNTRKLAIKPENNWGRRTILTSPWFASACKSSLAFLLLTSFHTGKHTNTEHKERSGAVEAHHGNQNHWIAKTP